MLLRRLLGNGQRAGGPLRGIVCLRLVLPQLDRSLSALLTDLHERGLGKDVAVVVWGEMGRTPRVGTQRGTVGGRDHWPQSGFALLAGGGLQTGQVIGATDRYGATVVERPIR